MKTIFAFTNGKHNAGKYVFLNKETENAVNAEANNSYDSDRINTGKGSIYDGLSNSTKAEVSASEFARLVTAKTKEHDNQPDAYSHVDKTMGIEQGGGTPVEYEVKEDLAEKGWSFLRKKFLNAIGK